MKEYIDISTVEKRNKAFNQFLSFEKIGDIYAYYGISDNPSGVKYVRMIAQEIGFDLTLYRTRKKKYCKNCGKELTRGQHKFCSSSCAATYNNTGRIQKEETREKIRRKLTKDKPEKEKTQKREQKREIKIAMCQCCGHEFKQIYPAQKYCSQECAAKQRHIDKYADFLEHPENYNRGNYTPKSFRDDFLREQNEKCAICGCEQTHNGKPLVFVLDHIDGDASNNKRENLRMICPNCDSQLPTFKSKNKNSTRRNYWKEHILKHIIE